jgi:putative nucleotide binding protein
MSTREEHAIVLDFLPHGYPLDDRPSHQKTAIVQAIGKNHLILLELVPKRELAMQSQEVVYIGSDKREKIHHINGKLPLSKLTQTGKNELEFALNKIIDDNEERFVGFFNNAPPLSSRMHSLELIPGLGKKRMWEIIEERRGDPFKSFEDLKTRISLMPDPKKAIIRRIIQEFEGTEKHFLFVGQ